MSLPRVFHLTFIVLAICATCLSASSPSNAEDKVLADFEGDGYGDWKTTGEAFGDGPASGTLPGQKPVSGYEGNRLVNSFLGGDKPTGTLTSPEFTIDRPYINLLVGGGNHPDETYVELLIDGESVRTATGTASTGSDDEHLSRRTWNVREFMGKIAQIRIVDSRSHDWGHINVDRITLSDQPQAQKYDHESISQAMASVEGALQRVAYDPIRPSYHFAAPALWMNDPNGPIYHDGWYHIFYQHNPYGDQWGHMHWGHARSRDLVHWEHLPIALWPSTEKGEDHCFSGSAAVNENGQVMLFYTSIGHPNPEQWAAVAKDDALITWSKLASNPILDESMHGMQKIDDWRDPFVFQADGKYWMVVGGHSKGGKGSIMLYEANDGGLAHWTYRGIAFQGDERNWECPNFFQVGKKFLLMYSPHAAVRYYTGEFDSSAYRFTPDKHGNVDFGPDFYATSAFPAPEDRWIVWGWVRGFPSGHGWNGCLGLPREVSIDDDGRLVQKPVRELTALRQGKPFESDTITVEDASIVLPQIEGNALEIEASIQLDASDRCGFELLASDGESAGAMVFVDKNGIEVAGQRAPLPHVSDGDSIPLRIFLDRSVIEVFAGDDVCITKVINNDPANQNIRVFAGQKAAKIHGLKIWKLGLTSN